MKKIYFKIVIILLLLFMTTCGTNDDENITFTPVNNIEELSDDERVLLFKVDSFRAMNGKRSFILDKLHGELALKRNKDNAKLDSITHEGFANIHLILIKAGASSVGENLGYKYSSAKTVFEAWVKSEKHRSNLLSDAIYTGASRFVDDNGTVYYCEIFSK